MQPVLFEAVINGNKLTITPKTAPTDNEKYIIKINDIKSIDSTAELNSLDIKVFTKISPLYTSINSVKSLLFGIDVDEELVLTQIREASRYAEYVMENRVEENIETSNFVKYTAAADILRSSYIKLASESGRKGQMGDVIFENNTKLTDISALIKDLKHQAEEWRDHMMGYGIAGKAKPVSVTRGSKANPVTSGLNLDITRGI